MGSRWRPTATVLLVVGVDYGSVPDWLQGVGTVLALFVGFSVLRREQTHRLREQAAQVAAWLEQRPDRGEGAYAVVVNNASALPVFAATVIANEGGGRDPQWAHYPVLAPGARPEFGPVFDPVAGLIVTFNDSFGRGWTRDELGVLRRDSRRWWNRWRRPDVLAVEQVGGDVKLDL